ncbi:putative iron-sulfur cluster assembly associated protein [Phaeomoniella chlamydospora]|uniref:Cytosolic Fe-S cluster assembly factor NAR1 n=1 Tax=Phaeomoniella chlamydospora TaxID=158046 RepID=A0A0G2F2T7_PHACM|nr:putative iron-sulfur cluster assembly associated protein [Phaeomoniella chlamydospora]
MSAILSSDDLNDFISPGVACIKPVETLPKQAESENPYEVTTEDKVQSANAPPASISLTDCLACSGCVTSAEAVLISLQSHTEVINTLNSFPSIDPRNIFHVPNGGVNGYRPTIHSGKLFVASVSPQVRASIAATYGITERKAGNLIDQLLRGSQGLRNGGSHGSGFTYVVDTNSMREACLVLGADELASQKGGDAPSRPILTSACPGWICYAEKTHPHVLPHLSRLKSPQALTGTLLKSVLSKALNLHPSQIWHLAIMPCFDKKLEASREELTDRWWQKDGFVDEINPPVRDVDCVITARELLTLANERGIPLHQLPQSPISPDSIVPFPDLDIERFLSQHSESTALQPADGGSSGGYMYHILKTRQSLNPGSTISVQRGRNADVTDYLLISSSGEQLMKCARFYGFRNIQNLVRKLKPARVSRLPGATRRMNGATSSASSASDYAYVEVMACPGGCTNGGGQIKVEDVKEMYMSETSLDRDKVSPQLQRDWLKQVDEAYFSASSDSDAGLEDMGDEDVEMSDDPVPDQDRINGISTTQIQDFLNHWSSFTDIPLDKLVFTSYRKVESDVGKNKSKGTGDMERVAGLASSIGGGW